MGTICILLGIIMLLVFTVGGYFISIGVIANSTLASLLGLAKTGSTNVYIICIGICFVIGLLICLNLMMHGMNFNKLCKLEKKINRFTKNHG